MLDRLRPATPIRWARRVAALATLLLAAALAVTATTQAAAPAAVGSPAVVPAGRIQGLVNAGTVQYVERVLDDAERRGAPLVVLSVDVDGGYEPATRRVVQRIEQAAVPVAVFVGPSGARASGAGLFILQAADVAVMAQGTSVGVPAPPANGAPASRASAATFARGLAMARGRDGAWVEAAVLDGASLTAGDALRQHVADDIASDVDDLLVKLDGRRVSGPWGTTSLATRGLPVAPVSMNALEQALDVLVDPNLAYVLLVVGLYGIIVELAAPGVTVPGVAGGACILMALYALANLPVQWAGVVVLVVAAGLLLAETQVGSHGLLALSGLATFVAGSFLLFPPLGEAPFGAPAALNPGLVVALVVGGAAFFAWIVRQGLASRRQPALNSTPSAGAVGIAGQLVDDTGTVHLDGQTWSAEWLPGTVTPGQRVRVVGRRGLRLIVEPLPDD